MLTGRQTSHKATPHLFKMAAVMLHSVNNLI